MQKWILQESFYLKRCTPMYVYTLQMYITWAHKVFHYFEIYFEALIEEHQIVHITKNDFLP